MLDNFSLRLYSLIFAVVVSRGAADFALHPLSDICPYNDFCHVNAVEEFNHSTKIPCCMPCSCSRDCSILGTCCPDLDVQHMDLPITKCKLTLVKGAPVDDKAYDGILKGIRRYRIVDDCPSEEQNTSVIDHCKKIIAESADDYVWVSDTVTGVIYQNRFCALCNHVTSFTQWRTRTTFSPDLLSNISSLSGIISGIIKDDGLDLITEVPDNERDRSKLYRCFLPKYSTCNQTGHWRQYDVYTETACESHTSPMFQESPFSLITYKNVYCFLCNVRDLNRMSTECRRYDADRAVLSANFSAIIDFTRKTQGLQSTDQSPCQVDEVYDNLLVFILLYHSTLLRILINISLFVFYRRDRASLNNSISILLV